MNFWRLWKTWENIGKNIENFLPFASRLRAISEENSVPFSSLVCLRQDSCHKRTTGDLWLGLGFRIGFLQELFYPRPFRLRSDKRPESYSIRILLFPEQLKCSLVRWLSRTPDTTKDYKHPADRVPALHQQQTSGTPVVHKQQNQRHQKRWQR